MPLLGRLAWMPVNAWYGAATAARRRLYRAGVFRSYDAPTPVISVGNISAGGTGKTPLVMWLAEVLAENFTHICVITRGYGRPDPETRLLVSDGKQLLAGAGRAGDEAALLAESLLNRAAVLCDRDRASASRWAFEELGAQLIILDDGFQHFRLRRVFDLVAVDASRPFEGLMRESRRALKRADAIVVTRADLGAGVPRLVEKLRRASRNRPVFTAELQTTRIRPLRPSVETPPHTLGAFCGVGNPQSFFAQVEREGFELAFTLALPDHVNYTQGLVNELTRTARAEGAQGLISTAKDEVKLRAFAFDLPVFILESALLIDREAELVALVKSKLNVR
jgi:tetraacyldisaccharide 4'-kinase